MAPGSDQSPRSPLRVPVLLPYPFAGPFDYAVPDGMDPRPGDVVLVPLNRREEVGVVWDGQPEGTVPDRKIKPLLNIVDTPPMAEPLRRLIDWMAAYTLSPPGEVMAMALRVVHQPPGPSTGWRRADPMPNARPTDARRKVLAVLAHREPLATADLARAAGVGPSVVRGMADHGLLLPAAMPAIAPFGRPRLSTADVRLSPEQDAVSAALRVKVAAKAFSVTLLDGVTGSGKTEVYLEAIAECVRQNRQALVLLPEIALSSQWLSRFERRFGVEPAVWHSGLSSRIRRIAWRAVSEGRAPVVVGARSALFLPFPDLGLIVVDEEHETSFKQEEGVVYNARDMAVVRARFCAAPAVLVSATPSMETVANVEAGRYTKLHLPSRHAGAALPTIEAIDMRREGPPRGR
ncbi:MAG: primosomal protein N', partial [Rhodospirillales bacterium]